jgi:hypothetical protein
LPNPATVIAAVAAARMHVVGSCAPHLIATLP